MKSDIIFALYWSYEISFAEYTTYSSHTADFVWNNWFKLLRWFPNNEWHIFPVGKAMLKNIVFFFGYST